MAPQGPHLRRSLILLDSAMIGIAWTVVAGPRLLTSSPSVQEVSLFAAGVVGVTLVTLGVIASGGLYLARVCTLRTLQASRLARAAALSVVFASFFSDVVGISLNIGTLVLTGVATFVLLLLGRNAFQSWVGSLRRRGANVWPVILVGDNHEAAEIYRLVQEHPERGMKVRGVVTTGHLDDGLHAVPVVGEVDDVPEALRRTGATGVLIASSALAPKQLNNVVRQLDGRRVHVQLSMGLQGIAHHRLRMSSLAHESMLYLEVAKLSQWQRKAKRVLDVSLAGLMLFVLLPALLVVALLVRRDGGPVLFRQKRVGLHGSVFEVLKFRTMVVDAEARRAELEEMNQREGGPLFKMANDPRVTRIGRFLRATSFDELPQLVNVLRGEMSLVGPRPALPEEAEQFNSRHSARTNVLPGMTGLWQIDGRDSPSFWSYERLDLFYLDNWSVALDLSIILSTIAVVGGRGLRAVVQALPWSTRSASSRALLD